MRVLEPLVHDRTITRLLAAARGGRLPHALLFEGPSGIGKFEAARWFASGVLCARGPDRPCGECGPCKRVRSGGAAGNHPDLLVVDPLEEGEERIRVHRIAHRSDGEADDSERCVEAFLDLRPLEGHWRVVLVRESHRMNAAAQNALLKTLEEPRAGTVLVLESSRVELLLPTIRSRCVRIRFEPLDRAQCLAVLEREGVQGPEAERLARWAGGSPGRALELRTKGAAAMRDLVAAVLRRERGALEAAAALWDLEEGEFAGATPTARARERARTVLDLALAMVRDRQRYLAGVAPDDLEHGDLEHGDLEHGGLAAAGGGVPAPGPILERLLECRADIDRNLAPEAVCERAFLALADSGPILSTHR